MIAQNRTQINPFVITDVKSAELKEITEMNEKELSILLIHNTGEMVKCLMSLSNNLTMLIKEVAQLNISNQMSRIIKN